MLVVGMEDVSRYPFLFSALVEKGYDDENINKVQYIYIYMTQ
jgi:microsomal dipeptidase-like Zn-dependent dipeptidase